MIESNQPSVSSRRGKPKGRFYDPPATVREVAGLSRKEVGNTTVFVGTAEAIAAAGILPLHLLPGQPGQPTNSVSLRPRGVRTSNYVHEEPGFMKVFRLPDGRLRVVLNVSAEELARREAEKTARLHHAEVVGNALLDELPSSLASFCRDAIRVSGGIWAVERWFNDSEWLARGQVTEASRKQVLDALKVFELVNIEKRLATSDLSAARKLILAAKHRAQEM
ncbi:hypothetical protein [Hydrogenophaga sp. PML113]|uniref:hypothetical protein n=1 Tax=Hydrogenophaga sp. PML113 TaxID=1899350 RepID=UPI0011131011|nr:hypothetical protein [Hydrogenophaga sp. PML113]